MGFKIGIELEGVFSKQKYDLFKWVFNGDYLYDQRIYTEEYFNSVADGSVKIGYTNINNIGFSDLYGRELVSHVKKNKRGFFNALKHLQKVVNAPLIEVVDFNKTCGCHVHFEFDNIKFKNVETKRLYALRRRFFKKITESNIKSKDEILRNYDRYYASKIKKLKSEYIGSEWINEKYSEFNLISENHNKGFEWRAINLCGVNNWDEFFEFWEIVYSCLEWFEKYINKTYKNNYEESIKLNEEISRAILNKLEESIKKDAPEQSRAEQSRAEPTKNQINYNEEMRILSNFSLGV